MNDSSYYYLKFGGGYILKFIERNPEFDSPEFISYLTAHNRGDRDIAELRDLAKHEVLRVAAMFEEFKWRCQDTFGEPVAPITTGTLMRLQTF